MSDKKPGVLRYVSGNVHEDVVIILDYMPPFPGPDTKPQKVVVCSQSCNAMLRFEKDPIWDVYGSDYGTVEKALEVLTKAPKPQKPYVEFTIPLSKGDR